MACILWLLAATCMQACVRSDITIGIYTEADFNNMRNCPCCDYAIANDITFSKPIIPIPTFSGTLYGQNYTLSNVRFNISGSLNTFVDCGIFGLLDQGTVAAISIKISHDLVESKIVNFGTIAGRAYKPRLYMVNVTGTITGTFTTPGPTDEHPHIDKGCSIGGIVGLVENEDGPPVTELQGFVNVSIANTNQVHYPLNVGNFFGRFESDTPIQHFVVHWSSTLSVTAKSNTTVYIGGGIGYCAADVVHATVGTNQTYGVIDAASTGSPTMYIGGAFGAVGSLIKILSWNGNTSCTVRSGTCVSGGIAGIVSTKKIVQNLTFGGLIVNGRLSNAPPNITCDAISCTTGGVIGSASADKLTNLLFNGTVNCRARDRAVCGGVFGNVLSSFKDVYSYASSVAGMSDTTLPRATISVGGLAGIIGGNFSNGEILNINSSVANTTSVIAISNGTAYAGGFAGRIFMSGLRLIRIYSSAAYSDLINATEVSDTHYDSNRATAGGFVALSTLVKYDYCYSYNSRTITATSKKSSAAAGGFIGDGVDTQANHLMVYNALVSAASEGHDAASVRVGGFAGGLEGAALVRYIGAFSNTIEGRSNYESNLHLGGFCGILQGAHSYGGFCKVTTLSAVISGSSGRYSVGGFVGTMSGGTSYVNGAWSSAAITIAGPNAPTGDSNKGLRVGGFVGTMESLSALNSTQAFGSMDLSSATNSSPKVGAMIGAAHAANVSACMSNVTLTPTSVAPQYKLIGYADGAVKMDANSMNFHVVEVPPNQANEHNATYLTWRAALDTQSYRNSNGNYYLGFDFDTTKKSHYFAKYVGEYPGLRVLPNLCSTSSPTRKQGAYCIFVDFNVYITLSSSLMQGEPFIAENVAPDTCPDISTCRGSYLSPLDIACDDGFDGDRCSNCLNNGACKNDGTCTLLNGKSYGHCKCVPGYKGVDCKYEVCGGRGNIQCNGLGVCTYVSDGFYLCDCPSEEYYVQNQMCIKGCTGLKTGMCTGPPTLNDQNVLCPPGQSYLNLYGSRSSIQTGSVAVIAILTILAMAALVLFVLAGLGKISFSCANKSAGSNSTYTRSLESTALLERSSAPGMIASENNELSRIHSINPVSSTL